MSAAALTRKQRMTGDTPSRRVSLVAVRELRQGVSGERPRRRTRGRYPEGGLSFVVITFRLPRDWTPAIVHRLPIDHSRVPRDGSELFEAPIDASVDFELHPRKRTVIVAHRDERVHRCPVGLLVADRERLGEKPVLAE